MFCKRTSGSSYQKLEKFYVIVEVGKFRKFPNFQIKNTEKKKVKAKAEQDIGMIS